MKNKKQKSVLDHIFSLREFSHGMVRRKHHFFTFFDFNHVIQTLIISEIFVLGAFGLLAPIFAIFVTQNIAGANIQTAGVAATVYLLTRSLGQVVIGIVIDRMRGERDDLIAMVIGTFAAGFVPLLYIFVATPMQLYSVQFLYGLTSAIVFPAWMATFTRHIDTRHEGSEWGSYRSFADLGMAIAAIVGGYVAFNYSFELIFIAVSIITFFAAFHLMRLRGALEKKHRHK